MAADWADLNMGNWGLQGQGHSVQQLSSINPYRSLGIADAASVLTATNNPPIPVLNIVELLEAQDQYDATLPADIWASLQDRGFFVPFNFDPSLGDAYQNIAYFRANVSRRFVMRASGQPDIGANDIGSFTSAGVTGFLIAPDDINLMVKGVSYSLIPDARTGNFHWATAPGLHFVRPLTMAPSSPVPPKPTSAAAFTNTATVTRATMAIPGETGCPSGQVCFVLNLAEGLPTDYNTVFSFLSGAPMTFALQANGKNLPTTLYGITTVNSSQNLGLVYSVDQSLMLAGVTYKVIPSGNTTQGPFHWIFPARLNVRR